MRLVLAFVLALATAGAVQAEPLRIAASPQVMEAGPLLYAAQAMGPGAAQVIPGGVANLYAEGDKRADVAGNAETQALRVSLDHPDLRIVQTVVEGLYGAVARRSAGIATAKDLRGKRIGVMAATSSAYFARQLLARAGLNETDVTLVAMAPNDLPAALVDRKVDAIAIWEPQSEEARRALGADAVRLPGEGAYREIYNLNTTAEALADPVRRKAVVAYLRALRTAAEVSAGDPDRVWPLVAKNSGFQLADIAASWPNHRFDAALAPDLLDVMVEEERWLAAQTGRKARGRDALAGLIDSGVAKEALGH